MSQYLDDSYRWGYNDEGEGPQGHDRFHLDVVEVLGETDKAWRVDLGKLGTHWLPKSRCNIGGGRVSVERWLCEDKGIDISDQDPF